MLKQASEIEHWLVTWLADKANVKADDIDLEKPFTYYGMDSTAALELAADVEDHYHVSVPDTAAWSHPNIQLFAELISDLKQQ